ncbi:MAG: hypothetical protein IIA49_16890 [Bacteroidetes bacterium]|nr:hypothetical protein [Bacteroidota bacterium]
MQEGKLYLSFATFSLCLTVAGILSVSYLATGPIKFIVFRGYHEYRKLNSFLYRRRILLYLSLLQWGRVEGLIPPKNGLRYKVIRPTAEAIRTEISNWKETVIEILQSVNLVIVEFCLPTRSILWEIDASLQYNKKVLILDYRASDDQKIHPKENDLTIINGLDYSYPDLFYSDLTSFIRSLLGPAPRSRTFIIVFGWASMIIGVLSSGIFISFYIHCFVSNIY